MSREKRLVSTESINTEEVDYTFRPKDLRDFVGQEKLKSNLKVFIEAAKVRGDSLDHILLHGPPGLGKTTLAHIIANEMGVNLKSIQAPVLEKTGDIAAHLTNLNEFDVFFIDEIHRVKVAIEEILYSAMEDFKIDIVIGQGAGAKIVKIDLPRFTLIGATTKAGLLTSPFYARFGIVNRLDLYDDALLANIAYRTASMMSIGIDADSISEIAKRSRGTPRILNRLMRRIRDFAQVDGGGRITLDIAKDALAKLDIDDNGLDVMDRRLLKTIIKNYNGGPVGLDTLAVSLGETTDTIEDIYEPFLIQRGFIARTPRGRVTTPFCYNYFGLDKGDDFLF